MRYYSNLQCSDFSIGHLVGKGGFNRCPVFQKKTQAHPAIGTDFFRDGNQFEDDIVFFQHLLRFQGMMYRIEQNEAVRFTIAHGITKRPARHMVSAISYMLDMTPTATSFDILK